jgi:hypothetical protein
MPKQSFWLAGQTETGTRPYRGNSDGWAGHSLQWDCRRDKYKQGKNGNLIPGDFYEDLYEKIVEDSPHDGVTWLPNQGHRAGWLGEGIESAHLIYFESDNRPIDEQLGLVSWLISKGIIPTVIHSGGKSLHIYIPLDKPLSDWDYNEWLSKLTIPFGGDPNIVGQRRRLMRFPGFFRHTKKQWQTLELLAPTDAVYSTEFIESVFRQYYLEHELEWNDYEPKTAKQKDAGQSLSDLSGIPGETLSRLASDIFAEIAGLNLGRNSGTYKHVFKLATGLGNLIGAEPSISLFESHFPGQRPWRSTIEKGIGYRYRLKGIKEAMTALLKAEWDFPDYFTQYAPPRQNTPGLFADLLESVSKKVKPVGFGSLQRIGCKINRSDRATEINEAIKNGQDVLDCSFMGEGKSYSVPDIKNPFGGKIWYLYSDHRNPTVARIADDFIDLDPRHKYGMKVDTNGKRRPIKKGDFTSDKISYGNCIRADLFPKLNELGYSPNDGGSENPICKTCPKHDVCGIAEGMYRFDRRETLEKNKIRAHLESLPRDFDYSRDIAIIDEASKLIKPTKTISATKQDLILDADRYREFLTVDQWNELDNWVQEFKKLFVKAKHFGDRHDEVMANLPTLSDELKCAINAIDFSYTHIFPDTEEATIKDNEEAFKGLSAKEKRKLKRQIHRANQALRSHQNEETETNLESLPPNLIAHIVNGAIIRVKKSGLTLTINRLDDIPLKDFANLVYLDATANPENLSLNSGRDKPIKIIRSENDYPLENLTVDQIITSGIGSSSSPTPNGIRNIKAIRETIEAEHGEMPFLAHKGWSAHFPELSYYWHRDSRGSNDFIGQESMIAAGLPCPNLGAIEDEYLAMRGNLDGLEEHYQRLVNEEILQWAGRPRPTRAPDKKFNLFLICRDWDLTWLENYGATVNRIPGYRLAPQTSTAQDIARAEILEVVLDFHRRGTAPKLIDVSEALDKSDSAIRKTLKAWNVDLATLYKFIDDSTRTSSTTSINSIKREGATTKGTKNETNGKAPPSPVEYSEVWGFAMKLTREQLLEEAGRAMADGGLDGLDGLDGLMRTLEDYPPAFRAKMMAAVALEYGQAA